MSSRLCFLVPGWCFWVVGPEELARSCWLWEWIFRGGRGTGDSPFKASLSSSSKMSTFLSWPIDDHQDGYITYILERLRNREIERWKGEEKEGKNDSKGKRRALWFGVVHEEEEGEEEAETENRESEDLGVLCWWVDGQECYVAFLGLYLLIYLD